jgi:two-component system NtrC family sensor kinase
MRRKLPLALLNRSLSVKLFLAVITVIGLIMLAFALMNTQYEKKILISLFLCLSASLYCCLYFLVLRPVRRLTELTNHIDQGNYDRPVSVGSEDELGQLVESLNELNRKLKARTADLLKKRADYQALISSVSNYVVAINRNFEIVMVNERFQSEFGIHSEGICYRDWKNRSTKCENCPVERSFLDGKIHTSEETVVFKDGRQGQMAVRTTPVKNEQGDVIYVLEAATDITEKRRLEEELGPGAGSLEERVAERFKHLQTSAEKYRTMFERCQDMILFADPQGKIVDINPCGVDMLGYGSKDELLAVDSLSELFDDPGELARFRQQLLENGMVKGLVTRYKTKHGNTLDISLSANLISDENGRIIGYEGIARDITRQKQMIDEMRRNSEQLSALNRISLTVSSSLQVEEVLANTIDLIVSVLQVGSVRVYFLAEGGEHLYLAAAHGLSREFVEDPLVQRRALGEGLLGDVAQQGETVIAEDTNQVGALYRDAVQKEGLQSVAYIPLRSKGRTVGVLSASSHFSEKFSSQQIEFLTSIGNQIGMAVENANLYEKTRKALEDVSAAQEQVMRTEKLASLGKLAATIAHEINNPLAVVLTYIRLMLKLIGRQHFTPERLEDINRYLATMEVETSRCGEIVKNLLAFARQSQIDMKANSIRKIIDRTLPLVSHDLELRGIRLVKKLEEHIPDVQCDFKQIQQALLNVLGNAAEAMTEGGTLTLQVCQAAKTGYVEVVVTDTGCGIPPENLKDIFEPFFTTKEERKGVGLGLAVVYGIVARHRGTIEVESPPVGGETGSRFRILLPIAVETGEADEPEGTSQISSQL